MSCRCEHNVSLKDRTWIHRGGNVNDYYIPESVEELVEVGRLLYNDQKEFLTVGHTSNMYFKDSFSIESFIDTRRLTSFKVADDNTLVCDCGVHMSKLSQFCVENGFVGYEGLINLPGTVGGAIVNNSGCYNCGVDKVLKSIDLLTPACNVIHVTNKELGFSFRNSDLKTGKLKGIILRAYFDISNKGDAEDLKRIAAENTKNRRETQDPPAYNLGSTVNYFHYKKNVKNIIIILTSRVLRYVIKDVAKREKMVKQLTLFLYNRKFLSNYISDKRMGCFLWKDNKADMFFDDYLQLISDIFESHSIEIEIKK